MRRISKVLKKDNFMPEMGYIVVTPDGMSVYNGQVGIKYSRKIAGERLCLVADEFGPYGIPEPSKFLRTVSVLEDISSVQLVKDESALTIKFAGKGSIKVPVVINLHDKVPHLVLNWKPFDSTKLEGIEISSLWNEIHSLTTSEGESLWGDIIGVYGNNKQLVSFDYGVYLHSTDVDVPNFYCPRSLIDLGLKNIEKAIVEEDAIFLVGHDVQYVGTTVASSNVVNDMMSLKTDFKDGKKYKVTLDFTSGVWNRAKLFAFIVLTLKVKNGDIIVEHDTWKESIGKTAAPDSEFTTRISLLERWASGTFDHSISITNDGIWNLSGTTRGGMNFYAVLTDVQVPLNGAEDENVIDFDVDAGESLID